MILTPPIPTKKAAGKYDVLIWQHGPKAETLCKSYTEKGKEFLRTIEPSYKEGDVLEILCGPDQLESTVPRGLRVGAISPNTNKIHPFTPSPLH